MLLRLARSHLVRRKILRHGKFAGRFQKPRAHLYKDFFSRVKLLSAQLHSMQPVQKNMRDEVQEAEFVEDDDEPSAPPSAAVPTSQTAPGQTAPRSSKSSESHAEPKIDEESVFAKIDKTADESGSTDPFDILWEAEQSEKRAKEAQSGPATADSSSSVEDMVEELVQIYSLIVDTITKAVNIQDTQQRLRAKQVAIKDCRCFVIAYKEVVEEASKLSGDESLQSMRNLTSRLLPKVDFIRQFRHLLKKELRASKKEPFDASLFSKEFARLVQQQEDNYLPLESRSGGGETR